MGMSKGYRTQLLDFSKLLITDFNLMVSQTRIGFHKKDQVKEKEKSFNANAQQKHGSTISDCYTIDECDGQLISLEIYVHEAITGTNLAMRLFDNTIFFSQ